MLYELGQNEDLKQYPNFSNVFTLFVEPFTLFEQSKLRMCHRCGDDAAEMVANSRCDATRRHAMQRDSGSDGGGACVVYGIRCVAHAVSTQPYADSLVVAAPRESSCRVKYCDS